VSATASSHGPARIPSASRHSRTALPIASTASVNGEPAGRAGSRASVPVHTVSARLGHVDLRTTARYAAARPEQIDDIADVLDRRHQAAHRAGEAM
jgi:integrase